MQLSKHRFGVRQFMNISELKKHIKNLFLLLKPYLLPPHHRKVTNKLLFLAGTLLVDDYLLGGVLRWLLASLIQNYFPNVDQISTGSEGGKWGVVIIISVLIFSAVIHLIDTKQGPSLNSQETGRQKRDKKLYEQLNQTGFTGDSLVPILRRE